MPIETLPMTSAEVQRVDPVTLEIVRNGLKAVAQRITRRMIRSANSFIVKEMEDCSASILDARGQLKRIMPLLNAADGLSKSVSREDGGKIPLK